MATTEVTLQDERKHFAVSFTRGGESKVYKTIVHAVDEDEATDYIIDGCDDAAIESVVEVKKQ